MIACSKNRCSTYRRSTNRRPRKNCRSDGQSCRPVRGRSRQGMTLLLVIVCMVVLTTIVGAMVRQLAVSSQQIRVRNRKAQAGWLAESGIQRAAFRMKQDSGYVGETWEVAGSELGHRYDGRVSIEVKRVGNAEANAPNNAAATESESDDSTGQVRVTVTAVYPVESKYRSTVRKQITVSTKLRNPKPDQDTGATS